MAVPALQFTDLARLLVHVSKPLLDPRNDSFYDHMKTQIEPWSEKAEIRERLGPLFVLLSRQGTGSPSRRALASALQDSIENAASSLEGEQNKILKGYYERLNEITGDARSWPVSGFFRRGKSSPCRETRENVFTSIGGAAHDAKNTITVLSLTVKRARMDRPEILNITLGSATVDQALAAIEEQTEGEEGLLKLVNTLRQRIDSMRQASVQSMDGLKDLLLSGGDVNKIYEQLFKIYAVLRLIRRRMSFVQASGLTLFQDVESCIRLTKFSMSLFRGLMESHRVYDADNPMPVSPQACLTSGMIRSIVGKHIELRLRLASTWEVPGPSLRIWQLILNLAGNARRAMDDYGQIEISTENAELLEEGDGPIHHYTSAAIRSGDYVLLKVGDTGPGIPFDKLPEIFELFYSGADSSGYGLALAKDLVHEMGGFIGVDSWTEGPSKGTTFYLYLPRAEPTISQTASTQSG